MRQHNSSTSNSNTRSVAVLEKQAASPIAIPNSAPKHRDRIKAGVYTLLSLIAFDVAISLLFPYPTDPQNTNPGTLNLYFDYGRSLEGKVFRQLGETDTQSAPLAQAGWLDRTLGQGEPTQGEKLVAIYGMSFSNQIGEALRKIDPAMTTRLIAGPYAPPNHSFAAYQRDRSQHNAKVVIFSILASSVQGLDSMTGTTLGGEVPAPYTFPQYDLIDDKLTPIYPQIRSLSQLRDARENPQQWQAFEAQLAERDRFYDPLTFQQNWLDSSAILRMVRRSWARNHRQQVSQSIHTPAGFNPQWHQIPALRRMVEELATTAKQDGVVPIVLLIHDQGYDDHLYRVLQPTLEQAKIDFVSTHAIASTENAQNFVGDGHFTPEANQRIAAAVREAIERRLGR
jgi:hypothetical protein